MGYPDELAYKIKHFMGSGRLVAPQDELFRNPSWLAVYIGQGMIPERYDVLADARPHVDAAGHLRKLRTMMSDAAETYPDARCELDFRNPFELLVDRGFAGGDRSNKLVSQLDRGLPGQRADEPLAAAEMVQDQRMRDTRGGGDVLQPEPLGSGAGDQGLSRFQDQSARLFRRAALPFASLGDHY